ncbi:hypothetical protein [Sulfitobacter guttiformis]|uniref:Uncharacterized protein n=1 Tax=Sulfitobacter guttiformis TaxID=74349 RepID=A0A420DTR3_9RHOB|nr:hypothetical protein [Sulfitobacter guttiformis]KIN71246.1 hypothetical protein Z949_404 [Sulfitobacter guttiformis KCTC 32187]RKE97711.1 hypothetical protein C8N30_2331 [Sulfitobacter guttiformis]
MKQVFPTLIAAMRPEDIIATYGETARVFLQSHKQVTACIRSNSYVRQKEITKWDVDLAMEIAEASDIFEID